MHFVQLKNKYSNLPESVKEEIKKELRAEWKKLGAEKKIILLERDGEMVVTKFNQAIQSCINSLNTNKIKDVFKWIDDAILWEEKMKSNMTM